MKPFYLFILCILSLTCCAKDDECPICPPNNPGQEPLPIAPEEIDPKLELHPRCMGNNLYTSYIYEAPFFKNNSSKKDVISENVFRISLISPQTEARIAIKMNESPINDSCTHYYIAPAKGDRWTVRPNVRWKYDQLKNYRTSTNIGLSWEISIDGQPVTTIEQNYSCRSINQCVFSIVLDKDEIPNNIHNGTSKDYALNELYAGYVEEEHPMIDQILKEVLQDGTLPYGVMGYQYDEAYVREQLWAIWYWTQKQGIKYSSVNKINGTGQLSAQNVRFFSDVLKDKQANCVDGSCFLSSIYERMELSTFLVVTDNHMFLAIGNKQKRPTYFLETTLLDYVNLNDYPTEVERQQASRRNFEEALNSGQRKYEENLEKFGLIYPYEIISISFVRNYVPAINFGDRSSN